MAGQVFVGLNVLAMREIREILGFLWWPDSTVHYLRLWSQKNPRRRNQSLLHEAEHDNLLKVLEKNLDVPQDCTYADQKAIDAEVSPGGTVLGEVTPHSSYCCSIWTGLGVVPQCPPFQSRAPWAHSLAAPEPMGLAELVWKDRVSFTDEFLLANC